MTVIVTTYYNNNSNNDNTDDDDNNVNLIALTGNPVDYAGFTGFPVSVGLGLHW